MSTYPYQKKHEQTTKVRNCYIFKADNNNTYIQK